MEVYVGNGLPGGLSVVQEYVAVRSAGGLRDRPANPGQHPSDGGGGFVRELTEGFPAFLRNHQEMPGALRLDVQERVHQVVLIDAVTRQFALDDPVEKRALGHAGEH